MVDDNSPYDGGFWTIDPKAWVAVKSKHALSLRSIQDMLGT